MAVTYVGLYSTTLGSNAASVNITSIPQTYSDLYLIISARSSDNGNPFASLKIAPNSVATYYATDLYSNASAYTGFNTTNHSGYGATGSTASASYYGTHECYIANYTNTSYQKNMMNTGVSDNNNAGLSYASMTSTIYPSTSAITSILISIDAGNIAAGSTIDLYGIKNS